VEELPSPLLIETTSILLRVPLPPVGIIHLDSVSVCIAEGYLDGHPLFHREIKLLTPFLVVGLFSKEVKPSRRRRGLVQHQHLIDLE